MFDLSPDAEAGWAFDQQRDLDTSSLTPVKTYPLLQCPPLAQGLKIALMGTGDDGGSVELARDTMLSPEPIQNLARVRYAAVHAGASEIAVWR